MHRRASSVVFDVFPAHVAESLMAGKKVYRPLSLAEIQTILKIVCLFSS